MKNSITTLIILLTFTASAQKMNVGFSYLENQEYQRATLFLKRYYKASLIIKLHVYAMAGHWV